MGWMIVVDVGQGFDIGMDGAVCQPAGELFGIAGVAVYPVIVASFQKISDVTQALQFAS